MVKNTAPSLRCSILELNRFLFLCKLGFKESDFLSAQLSPEINLSVIELKLIVKIYSYIILWDNLNSQILRYFGVYL